MSRAQIFWIAILSMIIGSLMYDAVYGTEPLNVGWALAFALNVTALIAWIKRKG